MANRKKTPAKETTSFIQYSKKMCTRVTVFWMVYRVINFIVILLRPDVTPALVDLVSGVDTAQICNMGFYIGKSGFENVASILAGRRVLSRYQKEGRSIDEEDEEENEASLNEVFPDEESNG